MTSESGAPMISGISVIFSQLANTDDIMTVRSTFLRLRPKKML